MGRPAIDKVANVAAFAVLSAVPLLLFGFTISHAWALHPWGEVVVVLTMLGLGLGVYREARGLRSLAPAEPVTRATARDLVSLVCGAVLTYTLAVHVGLGAVVSAGLVALIAALVLPSQGVPTYCGCFVGMTSSRLLVNHAELALAAAVAGVVFVLTERVFRGFGGKLGAVAFFGAIVTGLGLKRQFEFTPVPEWSLAGGIVVFSVAAAVATYLLSVRLKHGGVIASAVVGVTGGLVLPAVFPGDVGKTLAVMTMCASFAGMSSAERFPSIPRVGVVGIVTGLFFIYSMPLAGGAGGKLGAIAFGSAVAVWGHGELLKLLRPAPSGGAGSEGALNGPHARER
jgi:hypothetical protein